MSEKRKKKNQLLVFLLITLCACGNQEGTRDNDTATEFVRERRERKDSGSVVQTTEKDEPQKILSDKKETETAHMDEQDTSTSSKQVSASVEMREKPLFQPLSEKSSVENVENYVQMIDHVKAMTDQNGFAGVGSNNYHRTEYPGGYYYDELIRTVRSSGEDSELDSLNGKYGYSDYTVTFYYNNPDYENNEDILSDGPIMIEGLFNGNKFQYYFFQNNMIRRVAANAVTD